MQEAFLSSFYLHTRNKDTGSDFQKFIHNFVQNWKKK